VTLWPFTASLGPDYESGVTSTVFALFSLRLGNETLAGGLVDWFWA